MRSLAPSFSFRSVTPRRKREPRRQPRLASTLFLWMLLSPLALASCARSPEAMDLSGVTISPPDVTEGASYGSHSGFSFWNEKPGDGAFRGVIDLSEQAAYFHRGTVLVGRSRVATGTSRHPTPTGSFTILEKKAVKRSTTYGRMFDAEGNVTNPDADIRKDPVPIGGRFLGASMPYWMRLTNYGIGMHAGPIPNPGYPASHGCIRMPRPMAEWLFSQVRLGTPIEIRR